MTSKFLFNILFILTLVQSYSQTSIIPRAGISFGHGRMITSDKEKITFDNFVPSQYFSIGFEHCLDKNVISFHAVASRINVNIDYYYKHPELGLSRDKDLVSVPLFQYHIEYKRQSLLVLRNKNKVTEHDINSLFKVEISPTIGIGLSKLANTDWNPMGYDTVLINNEPYIFEERWDGDYIVQSKFGLNASLGLDFHFFNKGKSKIVLGIRYNQGMNTLLRSMYKIKEEENIDNFPIFSTKGSSTTLFLSVPIRIIKKKQ